MEGLGRLFQTQRPTTGMIAAILPSFPSMGARHWRRIDYHSAQKKECKDVSYTWSADGDDDDDDEDEEEWRKEENGVKKK